MTPRHCVSSGRKVQQVTDQSTLVQALPTSLRVLQAYQVPAEVLMQLTALERLRVEEIGSRAGGPTCILSRLSALQRLTQLHLSCAGDEHLPAIAGCTGLRALCLDRASLPADRPQPIRHFCAPAGDTTADGQHS